MFAAAGKMGRFEFRTDRHTYFEHVKPCPGRERRTLIGKPRSVSDRVVASSESPPAVELFSTVPLFKGLEPEELKSISNSSKQVEFKAGDYIVREGEAGLGFYVIACGHAAVKRKGKSVAKLRRGDFFGEKSLLDNQPRSADVVADEPTRCLVLLRWNFWALVSKNKRFARSLLEELARRLRATSEALTN